MGSVAPQKASNYDEIFMQHSLHFAESLKDLKNLRNQLYSAAEYFESSYDKDDHQQLVIESSKDYVGSALVSTVDHLGSVADKLNKFLVAKTNEFSATDIRLSCIHQRLSTFREFIELRGISQHWWIVQAPKHNKKYIEQAAETYGTRESKLMYEDCIPSSQSKQDNPFAKDFQVANIKPQPPLLRKAQSSGVSSLNPANFSFTRAISKKETGKHLVSPLRFPLKRSGSATSRSISPSPLDNNKHRCPSVPPRATKHNNMTKKEKEMTETYIERSKHLFKALFAAQRSTKEDLSLHEMIQR